MKSSKYARRLSRQRANEVLRLLDRYAGAIDYYERRTLDELREAELRREWAAIVNVGMPTGGAK